MPKDLLVLWNDGATKRAIPDFVACMADEGDLFFVPSQLAHCSLRQQQHALARGAGVVAYSFSF
jgi:hypothetical protein